MQKPVTIPLAERLRLFPDSTTIQNDSILIAGCDLGSLAAEYGTPLYMYDLLTLNNAVRSYTEALSTYYPARSHLTYAGKAFLCKAIAAWTQTQDLFVDCTGEGEIAIADAADVSRERILVHGVNKSISDLQSAVRHAGTIVIDNLSELERLELLITNYRETSSLQPPVSNLWLRLLPGIGVHTHHIYTETGHHGSKFGMTRHELLEAARFCKEHHLPLKGIHFHLGSNFRDPEPLIPSIELALDLAREIGFSEDWHLCPGGGWAVAYHEQELPGPSIESYVRGIADAVIEGCGQRGLELPHLHLEPGRSLIAQAGVALYRVGAVKKRGEKTWLLIDGGMGDNPRFALYGARYSCLPVKNVAEERAGLVSIGGPFCESGDVIIEDLAMPDIQEGDLIAVPVAGAYQLSMASNYNGSRRPAAVMLEDGKARLILQRETVDDLLRRQV